MKTAATFMERAEVRPSSMNSDRFRFTYESERDSVCECVSVCVRERESARVRE